MSVACCSDRFGPRSFSSIQVLHRDSGRRVPAAGGANAAEPSSGAAGTGGAVFAGEPFCATAMRAFFFSAILPRKSSSGFRSSSSDAQNTYSSSIYAFFIFFAAFIGTPDGLPRLRTVEPRVRGTDGRTAAATGVFGPKGPSSSSASRATRVSGFAASRARRLSAASRTAAAACSTLARNDCETAGPCRSRIGVAIGGIESSSTMRTQAIHHLSPNGIQINELLIIWIREYCISLKYNAHRSCRYLQVQRASWRRRGRPSPRAQRSRSQG